MSRKTLKMGSYESRTGQKKTIDGHQYTLHSSARTKEMAETRAHTLRDMYSSVRVVKRKTVDGAHPARYLVYGRR